MVNQRGYKRVLQARAVQKRSSCTCFAVQLLCTSTTTATMDVKEESSRDVKEWQLPLVFASSPASSSSSSASFFSFSSEAEAKAKEDNLQVKMFQEQVELLKEEHLKQLKELKDELKAIKFRRLCEASAAREREDVLVDALARMVRLVDTVQVSFTQNQPKVSGGRAHLWRQAQEDVELASLLVRPKQEAQSGRQSSSRFQPYVARRSNL